MVTLNVYQLTKKNTINSLYKNDIYTIQMFVSCCSRNYQDQNAVCCIITDIIYPKIK